MPLKTSRTTHPIDQARIKVNIVCPPGLIRLINVAAVVILLVGFVRRVRDLRFPAQMKGRNGSRACERVYAL